MTDIQHFREPLKPFALNYVQINIIREVVYSPLISKRWIYLSVMYFVLFLHQKTVRQLKARWRPVSVLKWPQFVYLFHQSLLKAQLWVMFKCHLKGASYYGAIAWCRNRTENKHIHLHRTCYLFCNSYSKILQIYLNREWILFFFIAPLEDKSQIWVCFAKNFNFELRLYCHIS